MKALVYHGPAERAGRPSRTRRSRIPPTRRQDRRLHDLRDRSPHPQGRRARRRARHDPRPRGGRHHRRDGRRRDDVEEGDRVLVSCITACGRCRFCREGHYGLCSGGGGWIFGHLINGLQAEYARVPFADTSVYKIPEGLSDEQVLFLADILPTAYEVESSTAAWSRATRSSSSAPGRSGSRRS